jgi:hypothetical protein
MVNRLSALVGVLLWIVVIFGVWTSSQAFNSHITEDPTKILQKYLSLDKKGVRLEAYSWQGIWPYVAWREEPVWGHVVVISQFEVVDDVSQWEVLDALEAKVPVIFEVVGTMYWESATFVPDPRREFHYFHIKAVQDRWKIIAPQLPPHVGRQRLIDFVRWTELNEQDLGRKELFGLLKKHLETENEKDL